jgi:serine phosphatase RsbU (regulator of sigma subunit)
MPDSISVLLVEDNPGDARLLRESVAEAEAQASDERGGPHPTARGRAPHLHWVTVERLDEALRRLEAEPFDVMLLDLSLPDTHGFDTFVRASARAPELPIVVLTGNRDEDLAVQTVQAGAQDYLVKPSMDGSLVVRALRYAIERRRLLQALQESERRQREIAYTLQRSLLPPALPRIPGVELGERYLPVGEGIEVGGDFYDVFETGPGSWALVIGDVAGKGPQAAAVTALARYTIRAVAPRAPAPGPLLARVNEVILPQISQEMFCTICYASLEPTASGARVRLACAGHPLPFLLRSPRGPAPPMGPPPPAKRVGQVRTVGQPGMIVGVCPHLALGEEATELAPGDALVFYTDGVTEARRGDELFGESRLAAVIEECTGLTAQRMADRIERAVREFQGGQPRDDLAIFVVRIPVASGRRQKAVGSRQ